MAAYRFIFFSPNSPAACSTVLRLPQVVLDKQRGRSPNSRNFNVRFYGNPGTGKTTVARLYAQLLEELGVLPQVGSEQTICFVGPSRLCCTYCSNVVRWLLSCQSRLYAQLLEELGVLPKVTVKKLCTLL